LSGGKSEIDPVDLEILRILQRNCKLSWADVGAQVGLTAPSVIERVRKLEAAGGIRGYHAILDGRRLGLDVTAFVGVIIDRQQFIEAFERQVEALEEEVLECHHVTGGYTLLLKVKTPNTASLKNLIQRIRAVEGVSRTETMVVLSTHTERVQLHLEDTDAVRQTPRRSKKTAEGS